MGVEKSPDDFLKEWFKWENHPNKKLLTEIQSLRAKGFTCCLAANQEKHRAKYIQSVMKFDKFFDYLFFSSDLGYVKPSKKYFSEIKKHFPMILPRNIIYWDNKIEHVKQATRVGFKSELFSNVDDFKAKMDKYPLFRFVRSDPEKYGQILFDMERSIFTRDIDLPARNVEEKIEYLRGSEVYIVYDKLEAIAFFAYKIIEGKTAEVMIIGICPDYQNKGIGKEIMRKIKELTNNLDLKLVTHPLNSQGIIYYLKNGFAISKWKNNYYGDGSPRIVLELSK